MKFCPFCGKEIQDNATKCRWCKQFTAASQETLKKYKKCPYCFEEILSDSLKCKHCGEFFENSPKMVVTLAKSRGIFIILGLFFGCFGVHNFYAGYYGKGALQLIITSLLGWIIIGFIITAFWALLEVIIINKDANGETMT